MQAKRFVHRATPIEAWRNDGDLAAMQDFADADADVALEHTGTMWITTRGLGRTGVFPLVAGHWLVRWPDGRLAAMSDDALKRLYEPEAISA